MLRKTLLLGAAGLLAACSTTHAVNAWRDTSFTGKFGNVVIGVAGADYPTRSTAEDALVTKLPAGTATASYKVIPQGEEKNIERVKAILREKGFDGALVVRLIGKQQELTTSAVPVAGAPMYGYWGYAYSPVYSVPMVDVKTVVRVEAKLYDVASERPVWSVLTETVDPTSQQQVREGVVTEVAQVLLDTKLLAKK